MSMKERLTFRKKGHPQNSQQGQGWEETTVNDTLNIFDNSETRTPTLILENHPADSRVKICEDNIFQTLSSRMGTGGGNVPMVMTKQESVMNEEKNYVVRRLTPDECALLQGYPMDWCNIGDWTDSKGKVHKDSDSAKYKAYGNSIALPQWQWIIDKMAAYLPEDAKLGSLFDGIGGFPLCWERIHGKGTARWASEIEEFPIAVTKIRFQEETTNDGK